MAGQAVGTEVFFPEDDPQRDMRLVTLSIEGEHRLAGPLWLRGATGILFTQGDRTVHERLEADGGGVHGSVFLRIRPMKVGPIAPFAEAGGGGLLTTEAFPPGGTFLNLTYRLGVGLALSLSSRVRVDLGFRVLHVSNGKRNVFDNPAYNGRGVMLAVRW